MAIRKALHGFLTFSGQTTSATAGTNKSIPHGLQTKGGGAITPQYVIITETGPDLVQLVSVDQTNVVVKSAGVSAPFSMTVVY